MKREEGVTYISMLSGGQDSSAMTLRALELGYPVDYIVFCDTGLEFEEMYKYIEELSTMIKRKYGITVTTIHPRKTFKDWYLGEVTSGDMEGQIRGVPLISAPCYWRRESKDYAFKDFIKREEIAEYKTYVGYVFREVTRWKDAWKFNSLTPLVEWKWNENEVKKYLRDNEAENRLYQHFSRTGCAICPKQGGAFYNVYRHYNKYWEQAKQIEQEINTERRKRGEKQRPSFHVSKFTEEMEEDFKRKDKSPQFDLGYEAPKDCFCKI